MEKSEKLKHFSKTINTFGRSEPRAEFMKIAREIFEKGYRTDAALLLLSTWNYNNFKRTLKEFNYDNFEFVLKCLEFNLDNFTSNPFEDMNLTMERTKIINLFNCLCDTSIVNEGSEFGSIGSTGAAKILYLFKPNQFIMWDSHIRGEDSKEKYKELENIEFYKPIFKEGKYPTFNDDGLGYYNFLCEMQKLFCSHEFKEIAVQSNKSLAKCIDEFNFINISLKIK